MLHAGPIQPSYGHLAMTSGAFRGCCLVVTHARLGIPRSSLYQKLARFGLPHRTRELG
jgi:hypothetical protein